MKKVVIPDSLLERCLERYYRVVQDKDAEEGCNAITPAEMWSNIVRNNPLGEEKETHLAECEACQAMMQSFRETFQDAFPSLLPN
jgi:hypothetical protein